MLCDSTLQRCQSDGKKQLFGSVSNADSLRPDGESRLKQLIEEGNSLAALNAVKTCQKVTDNCLVNACMKNPLSCVEGTKLDVIDVAQIISGGTNALTTVGVRDDNGTETATASSVRKLLKTQCLDTIGANKYCHMTYLEKVPSSRDLGDPDLIEEVFSLAYSARQSYANTKIQEAVKKFDTDAKNKCVETIKSCAMRSCGGGLGSVCYTKANSNGGVHVNGSNTYGGILSGCAAIVNADANCIYAAKSGGEDGYTYTYYDDSGENSTFNKLFPEYTGQEKDMIGAVATLNALLATSYNAAAIENMKKQCQTVALSCVKSMCGKDYTNCYRNRTDIISGSYSTEAAKFDRSMNKMGGVLDYNIVQGLCMNTVKNSSVCEEHLKIAIAEEWPDDRNDDSSWSSGTGTDKYTSVRDAWRDANSTGVDTESKMGQVVIGCRASNQISMGGEDCSDTVEPVDGKCIGVMEGGCVYDTPVTSSMSEYVLTNSATSLFQQLLMDVEKEVQAIYNAKLTKEQNVCLSNNNGGIMGSMDNGSTFMWVKLKSSKVPKNYQSAGLSTKQFIASNDLYGSFCRARVTIMSDDKDIQDALGKDATAYFAVGDSFTCGSWISSATLQKISDTVGERELCKQGYGKWVDGKCDGSKLSTKEKITYAWATVAPALAGGAIGAGLTGSGLIGNAIKKASDKNSTTEKGKTECQKLAGNARTEADSASRISGNENAKNAHLASARSALASAAAKCMSLGGSKENCPEPGEKDTEAAIKAHANTIENTCAGIVNKEEETALNNKTKAANIAIPIATTLAGGALGAGITASVLKQKKENIRNEAAQKWMDEVGEHIQCYIGTDEVGTYGDVVSIELD